MLVFLLLLYPILLCRLKNEIKINFKENYDLNEEVFKFLASEVTSSIREMVGALNRIISFSRVYNKVPSLVETKIILKDLLNISENKVDIDLIQTIACMCFKISKTEMRSSRRSRY